MIPALLGTAILAYAIWRYRKHRKFVKLQWPKNLSEGEFRAYCRDYMKHKGWAVVPALHPLDWRAIKGRKHFTICCDARTRPLKLTVVRDISDHKRSANSVIVLNGKLSSAEWHLLDHYKVKSIHYTELSEHCERMLTGNVYDIVDTPRLIERHIETNKVEIIESPKVEVTVSEPAEIDAPVIYLPGDLGYCTIPSAAAQAADVAELPRRAASASSRPQRTPLWLEINDALISTDPLACLIEENVYATPFKMSSEGDGDFDRAQARYKHTRFHSVGAAYREDGSLIEESKRPGGTGGDLAESLDPDHIVIPPAREEIKFPGTTLYLGNYMNHYGHFITEFLSKLWCIDDIKFDQVVIRPFIFQAGKAVLFPFAKDLLNIAMPGGTQIRIVTGDAFFERVVIPAQAWPINSKCNVAVRPLYTKISAHFRLGEPKGRIFLTRNQSTYKRIANLAEIERVATDLGFALVNPETLPILDQMRLYANSHIIAGFAGTSLHNCLFSQPGATVIDLGDTRTRNKPHLMQSVAHAISEVDMYHIPYRGTDDGVCDAEFVRASLAEILREVEGE
jgi:Glycosyltransferase 61